MPMAVYVFVCDADVGSNNSGFYELSAVLTHKGRSSSSGHYVAWVRKKGGQSAGVIGPRACTHFGKWGKGVEV